MHEPIDPAIRGEWFAVASAAQLALGPAAGALTVRLLGRDIELTRAPDSTPRATVVGHPDAPCHVRQHCGCLWVCLGETPRDLFALPEFDQPGRRYIYMGGFGIHTGGLRVVENFLDMAHFPYVHAHILGAEPTTEVRDYEVERDPNTGELWARGCKFVQPLAAAASTEAADIDYVYRVVNPFTPLLYKGSADAPERHDIIFLSVQPVEEERCIAHFSISLFDDTSSDTEVIAFQQMILGQDKPILENHVHKRVPLDPVLEVPARADAASSAFRRWLRSIGLRYGVLPDQAPTRSEPLIQVKIDRKWRVAEDVQAFELSPVAADSAPLPPASAGAHIDLHLPGGLVRQYSVCNSAEAGNTYRIAVKREPDSRGGSSALHERLQPGDTLAISAPKNNFRLDPRAGRSLLIAGGIGITPLLSMAAELQREGRDYQLHHFCRSPAHAAFADEMRQRFGDRLVVHAGHSAAQTEAQLAHLLARPAPGQHVYGCGPGPLMSLVEGLCQRQGWPAEAVHFEHFKALRPADVAGAAFEARLARSGITVQVGENQTLVDALRGAGVALATNCEQGVCGTCLCRVLEGEPDHRDAYLDAQEKAAGNQMLTCVSRARSPMLVLDL